eukprot:TRINITY_DN3928_c0_g1_i1.p2 TRINITY_DN3928_c0_g1~~TRINITY_DN3928_c0_g1_i1.p2  ORF type:complete len:348 (+),score=43.91 TRINITY_DN3928_c0_g1_i1:72-1115(+)
MAAAPSPPPCTPPPSPPPTGPAGRPQQPRNADDIARIARLEADLGAALEQRNEAYRKLGAMIDSHNRCNAAVWAHVAALRAAAEKEAALGLRSPASRSYASPAAAPALRSPAPHASPAAPGRSAGGRALQLCAFQLFRELGTQFTKALVQSTHAKKQEARSTATAFVLQRLKELWEVLAEKGCVSRTGGAVFRAPEQPKAHHRPQRAPTRASGSTKGTPPPFASLTPSPSPAPDLQWATPLPPPQLHTSPAGTIQTVWPQGTLPTAELWAPDGWSTTAVTPGSALPALPAAEAPVAVPASGANAAWPPPWPADVTVAAPVLQGGFADLSPVSEVVAIPTTQHEPYRP